MNYVLFVAVAMLFVAAVVFVFLHRKRFAQQCMKTICQIEADVGLFAEEFIPTDELASRGGNILANIDRHLCRCWWVVDDAVKRQLLVALLNLQEASNKHW